MMAWLLIIGLFNPNASIVPGIATEEECHALAVKLGMVHNHRCVSYKMAKKQ